MQAVNVDGTENVLGLAHELSIPRTVYVSTTQAYGDSGPQSRDETFIRQAPCRTTYEQTKTDAHEIARQYQKKDLPLIIVCPNGVIGANDQSVWGYFQRLYVNHLLPPFAWSPDVVHRFVELNDLVEGITLVAQKGRIGETYFLCGEQQTLRKIFNWWKTKPGAFAPPLWLPEWLAYVMLATLEPLQRIVGLPAFFSRETVRMSATNWNYSSEKAERELDWKYCSAETMWLNMLEAEIQLLARRKGQNLIQRLKPLEITESMFATGSTLYTNSFV
jgi:dihydroflavonol-4-reductase